MAYLLGIDVGTSGTKTVLFDEKGNTVASALEEYPLYQPKIGWAEQEPETGGGRRWTVSAKCLQRAESSRTTSVESGFPGQMHGACFA
jgi:xylulokinase